MFINVVLVIDVTNSTVNTGGVIKWMDFSIIITTTTLAYGKTIVLVFRLQAVYLNLNQSVTNTPDMHNHG